MITELNTANGFTENDLENWLDDLVEGTNVSRKDVKITVDADTGNLVAAAPVGL